MRILRIVLFAIAAVPTKCAGDSIPLPPSQSEPTEYPTKPPIVIEAPSFGVPTPSPSVRPTPRSKWRPRCSTGSLEDQRLEVIFGLDTDNYGEDVQISEEMLVPEEDLTSTNFSSKYIALRNGFACLPPDQCFQVLLRRTEGGDSNGIDSHGNACLQQDRCFQFFVTQTERSNKIDGNGKKRKKRKKKRKKEKRKKKRRAKKRKQRKRKRKRRLLDRQNGHEPPNQTASGRLWYIIIKEGDIWKGSGSFNLGEGTEALFCTPEYFPSYTP